MRKLNVARLRRARKRAAAKTNASISRVTDQLRASLVRVSARDLAEGVMARAVRAAVIPAEGPRQ